MKSILVHIDASPRSAERLGIAQRLGRREGAEVTAVYAVLPTLLASPWAAGSGMAEAASLLAELDRTQRERAKATFDAAAALGPLQWADINAELLLPALRERALTSDLLVLGQMDADDARTGVLPPDLVTALIVETGKPTLVVPSAGSFEALAQQILVAWKPTREAARAVSAALPWLRHAEQIVFAAQEDDDAAWQASCGALEHWLRLHGVKADVQRHRLGPIDVGDGLLSLAADYASDLLVMGCYGHSRAREWVLGGASRVVLKSQTLPVLMAH